MEQNKNNFLLTYFLSSFLLISLFPYFLINGYLFINRLEEEGGGGVGGTLQNTTIVLFPLSSSGYTSAAASLAWLSDVRAHRTV